MNKIQFRLSIKISLAAAKQSIQNFQFHFTTFSAFPQYKNKNVHSWDSDFLRIESRETISCYSLSETHTKNYALAAVKVTMHAFLLSRILFSLIMIPFQCHAWHFRAFCSVRDKLPINFIRNFFCTRKKYSNLNLVFQCLGYHI